MSATACGSLQAARADGVLAGFIRDFRDRLPLTDNVRLTTGACNVSLVVVLSASTANTGEYAPKCNLTPMGRNIDSHPTGRSSRTYLSGAKQKPVPRDGPVSGPSFPFLFALGSLTLLVKGVFLLRNSSEGLGLSEQELAKLSDPAVRKALPPLPTQAAQVVQDFGTGALLLWPLLILGRDFDNSWSDPPRFRVLLAGAIIFSLGWVIRRLTSSPTA